MNYRLTTVPTSDAGRNALWISDALEIPVFPLYEPVKTDDGSIICSCTAGAQCRNAGKHPRTETGFRAATTDHVQITAWWRRWPAANVGIATGTIVVVDVDPRNGGEASLDALIAEHGPLPKTLTVRSGDGRHYYFKRPDGAKRVVGRPLAQGVDVKADGGYVVGPGSLHASGRRYEWIVHPDAGSGAASLPEWIAARLVSGPQPRREAPSGTVLDGFMGAAFHAAGWLYKQIDPGRSAAHCPWEDEHTSGHRGDTSTVVFAPSPGKRGGWWHCSHEHCRGRSQSDVIAMIPDQARAAARAKLGIDGPEPYGETTAEQDDTSWIGSLARNRDETVKKDPGNAAIFLQNLPQWKGVLAYDAFADRVFWARPAPAIGGMKQPLVGDAIADEHVIYVQHWLALARGVSFTKTAVQDAIVSAAMANPCHPLREYLRGLRWDGTRRLDGWLHTYLGASSDPYVGTVGRLWAISAVARALRDKAQADHLLVLEGGQGAGKSAAVRILAGEWFLGSLPDLRSKDASLSLAGRWIVEIGELDALRGVAGTRVKDFVSQEVDTYRPPYGRFNVTRPRSCVFVGTTNDDHWSKDPTGARRFWPVRVGKLDRHALTRDRDQIWAEAVHAYDAGDPWWPQDDMHEAIQAEQEERYDADEWETIIARWVSGRGRDGVTIGEVMAGALNLATDKWTRSEQNRVGVCLRRIGWHKPASDARRAGTRDRVWYPKRDASHAGFGPSYATHPSENEDGYDNF